MNFSDGRILPVLLISLSLICNGCTLYGLAGGAIVDSARPDTKIVNREDYNTIEILREITLVKDDRTVVKGKFIVITEEYLTIESVFGIENIKREEILVIEVKTKKNGIRYGLRIGLAMDAFLLLVLLGSCDDAGC